MPRYIDADAVLQAMWNNLYQLEDEMEKKHGLDPIERLNVQNGFESALEAVVTFPSSDVVEVVRCKDCIHFHPCVAVKRKHYCDYDDNIKSKKDYCSWAERREEKTDDK